MALQPTELALAKYHVPPQYNRGYGQPLSDSRGEGYFYSFGAITTAAVGFILIFLGGILAALPGAIAIYLGILGASKAKKPLPTTYSSKASHMGIWAIVLGTLIILISLGILIFISLLSVSLDPCTLYEPGSAEHQFLCLSE